MLLVTGITGHSGRWFLNELIQNKYQGDIRCIVREFSVTRELLASGLNVQLAVGDLNDSDFVERAMSGVDQVMHIYNIHHSPLILRMAMNCKVKRVILVHTTGIYSKFKHASDGYKKIEEEIKELANSEGCPTKVTILRPTMIYGDLCDRNMSKFIRFVDRFRLVPIIDGGQSLLQPVNARDLGKAFYAVLNRVETVNEEFDLSGHSPIQMLDVYKLISSELGKRTVFINIPLSLGVFAAKMLRAVSLSKIDIVEKVQRMGENRSYSHQKAKDAFGYQPMSFEDGIHIEVQQYLDARTRIRGAGTTK